jgi:hypothetical protein
MMDDTIKSPKVETRSGVSSCSGNSATPEEQEIQKRNYQEFISVSTFPIDGTSFFFFSLFLTFFLTFFSSI